MKKIANDLPEKLALSVAINHTTDYILTSLTTSPSAIQPITAHLATSLGKGIRTRLLMTCAIDESGLVPKNAIYAGAAVEIFHMATLVHDDIIDEADTRRNIQSVHARFGKKEAVICGDYLLCVALRIVSFIGAPYIGLVEKFAQIVERVCLGELRQLSNNYNTDITLFDYLRIIRGKTAALFYVSAYAGGLLAAEDPNSPAAAKEIRQLSQFGTQLGMLFQMIDDCKDYMLSEAEALKPTKKDIATGVINLPLLMAFLRKPELRPLVKEAMADIAKHYMIFDEVARLGGVSDAYEMIDRYERKAQNILSLLKNRKKAEALKTLLEATTKK